MHATELKSNEKISLYNQRRQQRMVQTPANNPSNRKDMFLTGATSEDSQIVSQSQVQFRTYRGEVLDLKDKLSALKRHQNFLAAK